MGSTDNMPLINSIVQNIKKGNSIQGAPNNIWILFLLRVMLHLWREMNLPCSKQLKAAIPLCLPFYKQEMLLSYIYKQLLTMLPESINRIMTGLISIHRKHLFV